MLKKSFKVNKELYTEEKIVQTIEVFEGFEISYAKGELKVQGEDEQEVEQVFNEFMNYCLALHNEQI